MVGWPILGLGSLKNATYKENHRTLIAGTKQKVFIKIFTDFPRHTPYLFVLKYHHDSSCAVEIFLLSCIQLLFFTLGYWNPKILIS